LYEYLYAGLLELRERSESNGLILLRLLDALLQVTPDQGAARWEQLRDWFLPPLPVLEPVVLDAFDLLAEYGLNGSLLATWYRAWVEYLLALPTRRDRISLDAWLIYGTWIQAGDDLRQQLEQARAGAVTQEATSPLVELSPGYRIAIFTLEPAAAIRAGDMLRQQNTGLDVQVCAARDMDATARALAQNANLVVVVATCITHAMTYGIMPILQQRGREPVYPVSRGAASIVRAVEDALRSSDNALG
jgi:hypothetical protein